MGMFSWDCPVCHHSIRSNHSTNKTSQWMAQAVAVLDNGSTLVGEYDGYGRVGSSELDAGDTFALYHHACWTLAGKPEFTKPSKYARDQGFFNAHYNPARPTSEARLNALREAAEEL